jgi:hypothetical protein
MNNKLSKFCLKKGIKKVHYNLYTTTNWHCWEKKTAFIETILTIFSYAKLSKQNLGESYLQNWNSIEFVATLALGSRPRQGVTRLRAKRKEAQEQRQRHWKGAGQEKAQESSHTLGSLRKCEGMWRSEHSHSQGNSHFGRGSPGELPKLQRASWRVKPQWIVALFRPLKSSWNVDV